MRVTADDRAYAAALLEAVKKRNVDAVATVIAMIHERAMACASVRIEREYKVTPRKRSSPPISEGKG